ncbi:hypothetical protein PIB30_054526 [Stylosanthes scabra]|uniref:Uncharacterized protein n=1 Tax=Stylosanthes scabra TaxID=79078 RepID=A0ABU6WM68_9FABA|nr:hypothetical protein [Stylosanthes scabra]
MIETEKNLTKKERQLEVLEKIINSSMSSLEEKKAEISTRLADLDVKEELSLPASAKSVDADPDESI